jgi:hypothetical protein
MNTAMRNGWVAAAAAAAALAIGLGLGSVSPRAGAPELPPPGFAEGPRVRTVQPASPPQLPRASRTDAAPSLAARVERLARSESPHDAFAAFGLLARCVRAHEFDTQLKSLPMERALDALRSAYGDGQRWLREACGDLSMAQLDARIGLVERAARAGVPGAASAWIEQGPFGDRSALDQRPDDPLVVEWVQQAIAWVKSGATHDDIESIVQLGMISLNWELSDIERVKLLVTAAEQQEFKDQLQRLARRDSASWAEARDRTPP